MRLALALAGVVTATAGATVPAYDPPQIQARSNIVDGFNLPPNSSFNSGTPAINDGGTVAFRLIVVGGTGNAGLWVGADGAGSVVYQAPRGRLLEDPSVNAAGEVAFEQFDFGLSDGVFVYDGSTQVAVPTGGPFAITSFSSPRINASGAIGFRASTPGGQRFILDDDGVQTSYAAEQGSPIGFLFTASLDDAGRIGGKVRLGGTAGSQPDEIRVFASDGSFTTVAIDDDGDPLSPYTGFDNGIGMSPAGHVVFVANLVAGGRAVLRAEPGTDGTLTTIATTNDADVSVVEFFAPAVNGDGLVAFRGRDASGLDAVFVGDGTTRIRLIGEHDLIPTDLGTARIDQHDTSVTFGGSVGINEGGDVVFACTLTPPDNDQIEWGTGVFVAKADPGPLPGDVDGDGVVDFTDLLAVLTDWGMAVSPADLNDDGTVDFQDLLLVLTNWS